MKNLKKYVNGVPRHVRNAVVAVGGVATASLASAQSTIDTTAAAAEFTAASTAGGEIIAAALGVAALLMAGFMLVRRL